MKEIEIKENNYCFTAGDIGDALAIIVSQIEQEEYILEYVHYYAPYWVRGEGFGMSGSSKLSIVKKGYEDLYFVDNRLCPWMIDKVCHPINCIEDLRLCVEADYYRQYDPYRKLTGDFRSEFQDDPDDPLKVNPFPYLNEFIEQLAIIQKDKQLNKEEINELAQLFVTTKLQEGNKSQKYSKTLANIN